MRILSALIGLIFLAGACSSAADSSAAATAAASTEAPTTQRPAADALENPPEVNPDAEGLQTDDSEEAAEAENADAPIEPLQGQYVATPVAQFPHDAEAYTQGLEFVGDRLLESTGLYGESDRRWVDPETGAVEQSIELVDDFFGEGLTVVDDTIIQITWQEEQAIVSDLDLQELRRIRYAGEGWGLCYDGTRLVMSNGSSTLTFRDPRTFEPTGTIEVLRAGQPVSLLNELECVGSQVFANIYTSDEIVVIDPDTGEVEASIDGSPLRPADLPVTDANYALNGIAYRADTGQFFLTGKWWPVLYEVSFIQE